MMSCSDADQNSAKWICKRCTFENYPKSIKCTICLAPNSTAKYIISENDDAATRHCPPKDSSDVVSLNDSDKKWHCPFCTYQNWAKSMKCVICLVPRQSIATVSTANDEQYNCASTCSPTGHIVLEQRVLNQIADNHDKNDQTKINNNLNAINSSITNLSDKEPESNHYLDYQQQQQQQQQAKTNISKPSTSTAKRIEANCDLDNFSSSPSSTNQSPSSPNTSSSSNNSLNSSSSSLNNDNSDTGNKLAENFQTSLSKWRCTACTYDNFPKSAKCVLCSTPRAPNASTASAINSTNSSTNNSLTNLEAVCSGGGGKSNGVEDKSRNTPSPIQTVTSQRSRPINASNLVTGNAIINYSLNNNRRKNREYLFDWNWLEACVGVLNGDAEPVLVYLNNGGDLARQLTLVEVNFLNKQTLVGYTLIHLAIRFKRSEILELLLENRSPNRAKRVPCTVSLAYGIETRKLVNNSLKQRKGDFPVYYLSDFVNFALPQDILELSPTVQSILFEDLLDKDVQNELEESSIINWSLEINVTLGSRLYALWNRSTGDCLLDSALQATYGVFDKDNRLRKALADSLNDAAHVLFNRFKEAEILRVSHQLPYTLDQMQWQEDWAVILSIAEKPKCSLEQFHIFVLSHILRRPIIVYGIKFVKSYRGEKLALAGFQGCYLPLHFDSKFCSKSPISLAYTKGHFTALVPMEAMASSCVLMSCTCEESGQVNSDCPNCCVVSGAGNIVKNNFETDCCYLPLVTSERELLPLQFLVKSELGRQEEIMRQYLDCVLTEEGVLVCKQKLTKKPYPMMQMINEWIDFYRNIPVVGHCSGKGSNEQSSPKCTNDTTNNYDSDEESD